MANTKKPDALKCKIRSLSCRDDQYEFVKSLDPEGQMSFKKGFEVLIQKAGYSFDFNVKTKKTKKTL